MLSCSELFFFFKFLIKTLVVILCYKVCSECLGALYCRCVLSWIILLTFIYFFTFFCSCTSFEYMYAYECHLISKVLTVLY
jgi:hypothetical protein